MANSPITEERFTEALENVRRELSAGLTTVGVQTGAVEKTLTAKLNNLKLWGALALVSGQAVAAIVGRLVPPTAHDTAAAAFHSVLRVLS